MIAPARVVQWKQNPAVYIAHRNASLFNLTSSITPIIPPSLPALQPEDRTPHIIAPTQLHISIFPSTPKMQLPRILSPALCCLLTLSVQHVAGLAVPRSAPEVDPPSCEGTLPGFDTSHWTPEESTSVYACIQSECGYEFLFQL